MYKNAIIINGTAYQVKKMLYFGLGERPCDKCALTKKCAATNTNPCDLFNAGNKLAYFKKIKPANP